MPLADFNKDNPFVIIIRKLADELFTSTIEMTKILAGTIIFALICSILTTICVKYGFITIILYAIITIYNIITWVDITKKSELSTVNRIVYGDEYSATHVNNEKLFEVIGIMNNAKGKLEFFIHKLYFDIPIFVSIILVSILIQVFS